MNSNTNLPDFKRAALSWHEFGLSVIPIIPGLKRSTVKWKPWLATLSKGTISAYWAQHPDHEVGFIVGDDYIVFDADSKMAIVSLYDIEEAFDLSPALIVNTAKGEHHYFKRASGTYAKSDSHSSEKHPERIDVKTGSALVILPPSTGKEVMDDD